MKKINLNHFNLLLSGIFVLLIILYFAARIKNQEYAKINWTAEIRSASETTFDKANMVKVIDAVFYNTTNNSTTQTGFEIPDMIDAENQDFVTFNHTTNLLPDSLSLTYFSVDEKKFYKLISKLPYEVLKKYSGNKMSESVVLIEIHPHWKIVLKTSHSDENNNKPVYLATFTAKETNGNLNKLIYKKSLENEYNNFKYIRNINDFAEVLKNKYYWTVSVQMEDKNDELKKISANAYDEKLIEISRESDKPRSYHIPKRISIDWGSKQEYGIEYSFDADEILNAFRKLSQSGGFIEPMEIIFKLKKNEPAQCEISKDGIVIPLKDLYPDLPVKYSN
ncbi:hypothetical protein [Chryseobacterium sp. JUb7]|uniref:hypothetical protein n=1 Tax=Chryseobacterium sp. JUb7 TaxID=2940599 RepID=UPI002169E4BA|nr:hypothetical protein [Chryseobacterium sp. JUb7]MCS3532946.1 hypothetical protein [Chryseobacterium sp. JUb7]